MTWRPLPNASEAPDKAVAISDSLDVLIGRLGGAKPSHFTAILSRWEEFVGQQLAEHSTPESLAEGVLVVVIDDGKWLPHLKWLSASITERVNADLGTKTVERLNVRLRAK